MNVCFLFHLLKSSYWKSLGDIPDDLDSASIRINPKRAQIGSALNPLTVGLTNPTRLQSHYRDRWPAHAEELKGEESTWGKNKKT